MSTTIKIKSAGSGQPLSLATGELAVNYNNPSLWVGDAVGSAVVLIDGGTVSTISFDTLGLTPSTPTGGAVEVGGTLNIAHGGTNGSASPTAGGIAYGNGSAYAFTVAGATGQVLVSTGAGTPTWSQNEAGAMTLIATSTASSSASVAFGSSSLTGYTNYLVVADNVIFSSDDKVLRVQFSSDNGSTFYASNKSWFAGVSSDTNGHNGYTSGNNYVETFFYGSSMNEGSSLQFYLMNPAGNYLTGNYYASYIPATFGAACDLGAYSLDNTSAVNYVKFYPSSGTITSGTFKLYGIS